MYAKRVLGANIRAERDYWYPLIRNDDGNCNLGASRADHFPRSTAAQLKISCREAHDRSYCGS